MSQLVAVFFLKIAFGKTVPVLLRKSSAILSFKPIMATFLLNMQPNFLILSKNSDFGLSDSKF